MSTGKLTDSLVPFFAKACAWYAERHWANLPCPATIVNPTSIHELDPESREGFAAFYTRSENYSRIAFDGAILKGISTHVLPLLAGIHEQLSIDRLATIIEHHSITVDDFEDIWLTRQGQTLLFHDKAGDPVHRYDAQIAAWKAFSKLGMLSQRIRAFEESNNAAMHTNVQEAWPVSILKATADIAFGDEDDSSLLYHNCVVGKWMLTSHNRFPENSAATYIRRSGMLLGASYRKQIAFHHQWEDACIAMDDVDGQYGLKTLLGCNDLSHDEKLIARNALRLMYPYWGVPDEKPSMHTIFDKLRLLFNGTPLDISDSLILKINLSGRFGDGGIHKAALAQRPDLYHEILSEPQGVISGVCKEILSLKPEQLGYADFAVFMAIKKLDLGKQMIEGFSPEEFIIRLDAGLKDYQAGRPNTSVLADEMLTGLSDAFEMISQTHTWDYSKLQGCSQLTSLAMVRGGGSMKKLPDMGRSKRAVFLEDELGI